MDNVFIETMMYYDSQIRKRDEKLKGQKRGEKIIKYRNAMMNISTNNGKKEVNKKITNSKSLYSH